MVIGYSYCKSDMEFLDLYIIANSKEAFLAIKALVPKFEWEHPREYEGSQFGNVIRQAVDNLDGYVILSGHSNKSMNDFYNNFTELTPEQLRQYRIKTRQYRIKTLL